MNNFIESLNNFWFYKVIYQNIAKNAIKIGNWKLENISRWRAVPEDGGKWAANDLERWERALVCRWQIAMEMTFHRIGREGKERKGKGKYLTLTCDLMAKKEENGEWIQLNCVERSWWMTTENAIWTFVIIAYYFSICNFLKWKVSILLQMEMLAVIK